MMKFEKATQQELNNNIFNIIPNPMISSSYSINGSFHLNTQVQKVKN